MGLKFPEKSKAPAYVQPAGGYHPDSALDPCCIPESTPPLLSNSSRKDDSTAWGNEGTFAGFIPPTAH